MQGSPRKSRARSPAPKASAAARSPSPIARRTRAKTPRKISPRAGKEKSAASRSPSKTPRQSDSARSRKSHRRTISKSPSRRSSSSGQKRPTHTGTAPQAKVELLVEAANNARGTKLNSVLDTASTEPRHDEVTLFTHPSLVLGIFASVCLSYLGAVLRFARYHLYTTLVLLAALAVLHSPSFTETPYDKELILARMVMEESVWWLLLGIASSVFIGTGLHTFVLYLGPHIAAVTQAANACGHVSFVTLVEASDSLHCVKRAGAVASAAEIFWKIEWKALIWGIGTAIGELPPYFMARAARLASERVKELGADGQNPELDPPADDLQKRVGAFVERHGFWAILLMASVPNPLFDMAGFACGHFLLPFSTFIVATSIGKGFIKAHLQAVSMVLVFKKETMDTLVAFLEYAWLVFLYGMIGYFVVSLLNATAQSTLADRAAEKQEKAAKAK